MIRCQWRMRGRAGEQVAQLRREGGVPDPPVREEPPAHVLGDFEDDYGNRFTITEEAWVQDASSRYENRPAAYSAANAEIRSTRDALSAGK